MIRNETEKNINLSKRKLVFCASASFSLIALSVGKKILNERAKIEKKAISNPSTNEALSALCSSKNIIGSGLLGEYFSEENLQGQKIASNIDGRIDFKAINAIEKAKSVKWSGWIKSPLAGPHIFHFDHPDAKIHVSKQDFSIIRNSKDIKIETRVGGFYAVEIIIHRIKNIDSPAIKLEWTPPHGYRYPISSSMLFPPMT